MADVCWRVHFPGRELLVNSCRHRVDVDLGVGHEVAGEAGSLPRVGAGGRDLGLEDLLFPLLAHWDSLGDYPELSVADTDVFVGKCLLDEWRHALCQSFHGDLL